MTLVHVIGWAIVLATALVRWRREALALDVRRLRRELAFVREQVERLHAAAAVSQQEREQLELENSKLRRRCARLVRQIKRMAASHKIEVAALHRELNVIRARLDQADDDASRPPAAPPAPETCS